MQQYSIILKICGFIQKNEKIIIDLMLIFTLIEKNKKIVKYYNSMRSLKLMIDNLLEN